MLLISVSQSSPNFIFWGCLADSKSIKSPGWIVMYVETYIKDNVDVVEAANFLAIELVQLGMVERPSA